MAGDWIRMRSDMYRDPKVCAMAASIVPILEGRNDRNVTPVTCHVSRNVVRNAVVGALVTVWGVMRHRGHREGDDLVVNGVSISVLDDVADIPGFGQAMASVHWVESSGESLVFPKFFGDLNSEPSSTAKTPAERQREFRERQKQQANGVTNRNVTVTSRVTLRNAQREEREEEEIKPPYPPSPDGKGEDGVSTSASPSQTKTKSSHKPARPKREPPFDPVQATADEPWGDGLRRAWADWVSHQRERRSPLTPTTTRVLVEKLRDWGEARAVAAIKHSIANGWQGLIEPEPPKPATTAAQAPQPKPMKTRFPEPPPKRGYWWTGHHSWDETKEYDRECAWNGYWSAKDRWELQQALAKEKAEEEAEAARLAAEAEKQGAA